MSAFGFSFQSDGTGDSPEKQPSEPTASVPALVQAAASDETEDKDQLCSACEKSPRAARAIYGTECKKALNNITSDAKKKLAAYPNDPAVKEEHAQFNKIKKEGGPALTALILSYRAKTEPSSGSGKRRKSSFNLGTEMEEMKTEQKAGMGARLVYMHYARWLVVAKKKRNLGAAEAQRQWEETMRNTPNQLVKGTKDDPRLPMPDEEYIFGETNASHSKSVQLTSKPDKNLDVGESMKALQQGAFGMNDGLFSQSGGQVLTDVSRAGGIALPSSGAGRASSKALTSGQGQDSKAEKEKKEDKKRKRYDLMAAKNRCESKALADWQKVDACMKESLTEARKLLAEHKNSTDYKSYVGTLADREKLINALVEAPREYKTEVACQDHVHQLMQCVDVPDGLMEQCRHVLALQKLHADYITAEKASAASNVPEDRKKCDDALDRLAKSLLDLETVFKLEKKKNGDDTVAKLVTPHGLCLPIPPGFFDVPGELQPRRHCASVPRCMPLEFFICQISCPSTRWKLLQLTC